MRHEPIRMKRKVQQLGSSTLAVTVPAEWARRHSIEKGDEVTVQTDENGGSLLVVPERPAVGETEATIDADSLTPDALERAVVSQYVLGRQLIHVESTAPLNPEHRDAVTSAERRLMGLAVVEEGTADITIRCSVAPEDFDLPTLLSRLGRTEATMRADALTAAVEADRERAERVVGRYDQVETLFYLFLRLLFATYRNPRLNQAVGLDTGFPLIGYRSVAQDLVLMADVAREVAELTRKGEGTAPDPETAGLLTDLGEALDDAVAATLEAVTAADRETAEVARERFGRLEDCIDATNDHLAAARPEPLLILQRTVVLLERTARHARDSLSVASHLTFRADPDLVTEE